MGVYIKDMEMPESCPCKIIGVGYDLFCSFANGVPARVQEYNECCENGTKPDWCPLEEVSTPHGRLINADAIIKELRETCMRLYATDDLSESPTISAIAGYLEEAPTIIEADE